jgi:ubiquinone biosynthesis protein
MLIVDLVRLLRAAYVLAREGVVTALPLPEPRPFAVEVGLVIARLIERRGRKRSRSERLTAAVDRLGPSYVKLGQFLATRPDVVGKRMAEDLAGLQDAVAPFGLKAARAVITQSFGVEPETLFTSIGEPIAAASIAEVHKATVAVPGGDEKAVAVKVLRPGVDRRFASDLGGFYLAARLIERIAPSARRLKPVAVVDTLARSVVLEMDLRLEAAALSEFADNIAGDEGLRVPSVDWKRSSRSVLTMDWVDGIRMSDVDALAAAGHDLRAIAARLLQSFLTHAMRDGFFHADMHPGNLFVDAAGTIVAIDFGIMGRLGLKERRFLAEVLYGFIRRDYRRAAEVHFEVGYVPPHHDIDTFAQALRAIGEPLRGHTARDISMSRFLTQLFEVTELFDMQTRPELILLQKTMVVVEGVSRVLDPDLDMWKTSEPVVGEWIARNLGPRGRVEQMASEARRFVEMLPRLPGLVDKLERSLDAHGDGESELGRHLGWRLALPLWVGAGMLVVIATRLLG